VPKLEPPDLHHLNAALGWIGLGCADEAQNDLALISPPNQTHPEVLEVRWAILAGKQNWSDALEVARAELAAQPDDCSGWLHHAYALRRVTQGGLPQAWDALLPAAEKFPGEPIVAYNLSCYACQLQQLDQARAWLKRAIAAGQKETIKKMALADDDLKPLWPEIREL
jgi:tetratricopeptide (TPR) repeat protein